MNSQLDIIKLFIKKIDQRDIIENHLYRKINIFYLKVCQDYHTINKLNMMIFKEKFNYCKCKMNTFVGLFIRIFDKFVFI